MLVNVFGGAICLPQPIVSLRMTCCECGEVVDFEKSDHCEICEKPMCETCNWNNTFCSTCQADVQGAENGK